MAVTVVGSRTLSNSSGSGSLTLSMINYVVPPGDAKILFVAESWTRQGSLSPPDTPACTFDGVAMTSEGFISFASAPFSRIRLWSYPLGASTPTANIVASALNMGARHLHAFTAIGLVQAGKEAGQSNGVSVGPTGITTLTAGAFLVGLAYTANESRTVADVASDETLIARTAMAGAFDADNAFFTTWRTQPSAGPTTMTGLASHSANRKLHYVYAFEPVPEAIRTLPGVTLAPSAGTIGLTKQSNQYVDPNTLTASAASLGYQSASNANRTVQGVTALAAARAPSIASSPTVQIGGAATRVSVGAIAAKQTELNLLGVSAEAYADHLSIVIPVFGAGGSAMRFRALPPKSLRPQWKII